MRAAAVGDAPSLAAHPTPACAAELLRTAGGPGHGEVTLRCLEGIEEWEEAVGPVERWLAPVVPRFAVRTAEAYCDPPEFWRAVPDPGVDAASRAAFIEVGTDEIHLSPGTCLALERLLRAPTLPCLVRDAPCGSLDDESAAAQCHALQDVDRFAEKLGLSAADAAEVGRHVQALAWVPPEYESPECRAGGALDDDPGSPAFPWR